MYYGFQKNIKRYYATDLNVDNNKKCFEHQILHLYIIKIKILVLKILWLKSTLFMSLCKNY